MPDNLTPEQRRKTMRAVKSKRTKLEDKVSRELWNRGLRFRRNVENLHGKPDFAVKKRRVAVFVDSCFWHGCPEHCKMPVSNREFWEEKIVRNGRRDAEVTKWYEDIGWRIVRVWEHELKDSFTETVDEIERAMKPQYEEGV